MLNSLARMYELVAEGYATAKENGDLVTSSTIVMCNSRTSGIRFLGFWNAEGIPIPRALQSLCLFHLLRVLITERTVLSCSILMILK